MTAAKFKYRTGQYLWSQHKIYGWLRGKIEQRYEHEGSLYYRIVILHPDKTMRCLITAREHLFQTEQPMMINRHHFRNKPNTAFCNASDDGWYCVLAKLHVGDHEVYDDAIDNGDTLLHRWKNKERP